MEERTFSAPGEGEHGLVVEVMGLPHSWKSTMDIALARRFRSERIDIGALDRDHLVTETNYPLAARAKIFAKQFQDTHERQERSLLHRALMLWLYRMVEQSSSKRRSITLVEGGVNFTAIIETIWAEIPAEVILSEIRNAGSIIYDPHLLIFLAATPDEIRPHTESKIVHSKKADAIFEEMERITIEKGGLRIPRGFHTIEQITDIAYHVIKAKHAEHQRNQTPLRPFELNQDETVEMSDIVMGAEHH